ncbi:MAG: riboflavin synthase [Chitinispirillales bacterium]|jgi:riboflavin synthase|nr:riboflavin synthase [Chitinispirillales bacterium]
MFTGLIETTGEIKSLSFENKSAVIAILPKADDFECKIGDSVAIDGVCLTVEKISEKRIFFRAVRETLSKTTLVNAKISQVVNLERAMKADGRFGGHIVLGHIDTIAKIEQIKNDGDSFLFFVSVDDEYSKYVVKKGSVAVNGISLTVADLTQNGFSLSIIPHSFKNTTLALKKVGDFVNIECDVFSKYVERMIVQKNKTGDRILKLLEEGEF